MSEKKARASVFLVIAIIAFVCSCVLFSMTGGVSDWIGDTVYDSENTTDEFGFSEFLNKTDDSSSNYNYGSSSEDSSQSEDSNSGHDSSNFFKDFINKKDKDSSNSLLSSSDKSESSSDLGKSESSSSLSSTDDDSN